MREWTQKERNGLVTMDGPAEVEEVRCKPSCPERGRDLLHILLAADERGMIAGTGK